ncbi:MAG: HAD family phosphatase [Prevotellaceae bacterium]|jgi:putative hydrolase of the HAD superfamily|nr:HAD family phosphatase [Prevotellaceae bacterium]
MIKNILFDFGGVIVDIDRDAAVRQFKLAGFENIEEYLDPYRQKGFFHKFEDGTVSREEFYAEISKTAGKSIDSKSIDKGWLDFILPVEQKRLDLIAQLKTRYRMLLLSNTNPIVMEWANSEAFSLAGKPLSHYFDSMFMSYKMHCMKPDPEIFRQTIEQSGIVPEETLFIDDSKANIDAGAAFGLKIFHFTRNSSFDDIKNKLQ